MMRHSLLHKKTINGMIRKKALRRTMDNCACVKQSPCKTAQPAQIILCQSLTHLGKAVRNKIMNRRIFALVLSLGAAAFLAPGLALAEDHLAEAISHTKEAIDHGKQGHADVLVTHAEAALKHADAAEKAKDNEHTKQGITHLKAAIDHGKQKHADVATKHAEEALTHLEAATK
jgi:Small metal-binding protein